MAEVFLFVVGIGLLIVLLLLTLFALLLYSGIFEGVEVDAKKPPIGEVVIAYKFARGPYKDAGQLCCETNILMSDDKPCRLLNIYYDDPNEVAEWDLRYAVGVILSEDGSPIKESVQNKLIEKGYKTAKLPTVSYAVTSQFPYKSSLSTYLAISKVYPKLDKYIKEKKLCAHPFVEIYDSDKIYFMAPLAKQDEFYVEEAKTVAAPIDDTDDNTSLDDSTRDTSVSRSEASFTTYVSSYAGDDVSDIDELDEDENDNDNDDNSDKSGCDSQMDITPTAMDIEQRNITPETQNCGPPDTNDNDTALTSEPTTSSTSSVKVEGGSDGNESGSSFEEIEFDPKDSMMSSSST